MHISCEHYLSHNHSLTYQRKVTFTVTLSDASSDIDTLPRQEFENKIGSFSEFISDTKLYLHGGA